jgi:hypothetical protein
VVTMMRLVLPFVLAELPTRYIQEASSKFEQSPHCKLPKTVRVKLGSVYFQ